MFAIVTISGRQYKIKPGDRIEVDYMDGSPGDIVSLNHTLLVESERGVIVGTPTVSEPVRAKIVTQKKGDKIAVRRFKAKARYRRSKGFRPLKTTLEIVSIGSQ